MSLRIGVDLGGTKIEIVALARDGAQLFRRRVPTPVGDYRATLDAIEALVASAESACGRSGTVGVGSPGAISPGTGLLKNSNSTVLNGKPLDADIAHRLSRSIKLANDANCLALSESVDGAGAGFRTVFGVILGTGVGGGIAIGRRVLEGRNNIAGEWGHNPLPWSHPGEGPGPPCYCGKRGCLETFLSGPALAAEFHVATRRALNAREIAAAAEAGDLQAAAALSIYEDRLARGLAHVVNVLDPDAIVIGGGLSNISRFYANLPALMAQYVFSEPVSLTIVPALHGDSSGVRGAAWLWP
jgi:fructokinase